MSQLDRLEAEMQQLAGNLWWTWHPEAIEVWRAIDPALWRESRHSPVTFMKLLGRERLKELAADPSLRIQIHRVFSDVQRYMDCRSTWGCRNAGPLRARPVAYFCAEFGIHESMTFYSGGLGVLAGDHLKSASDLGIPMVGVSLLYREGYFRQKIGDDGEQIEEYSGVNPEELPLVRVNDESGNPLTIDLHIQGDMVQVGAWSARLGRVTLYFLDMDSAFREIGIQALGLRLYGGDESVRLAQEMVLGIGGMKLLLRLGISPGVIHLNEGHCAFAPLEYARHLMQEHGMSFEAARQQAGSRTVFTTHTPVPAGHDRFSSDLVGNMAWQFRESLGLTHDEFMGIGRVHPHDRSETLCMTVLGLKMASKSNAVSSIHGKITRSMWSAIWPDRSLPEIPVGHITNGINVQGWLSPSMKDLFNRYFPPDWMEHIGEEEIWRHIDAIPDEELWNTILLLKIQLLDFLPRTPQRAYPRELNLDSQALTIGFARRFAGYKRATLLLEEPERLVRAVSDRKRPVQIIFSGKAHPKDSAGKKLIRQIHQFATNSEVSGQIVFVEDYDINVARHLVQGVDLWLNCPRQGFEASGTSGMKVALNGGLNLSILDGWWPEGYDGTNGFAVRGSRNENDEIRDSQDREDLFRVIEEEVVPEYYDRDTEGIPRAWLSRIKQAMYTLGWRFSSDRMVMDYVKHSYLPAAGISTCQMNIPFV